MSGTKRKEG